MSDLTRSIIVPITKQLHLPAALTSELSGAAVRHFSLWITQHKELFLARMTTAARGDKISKSFDQRIRTNYSLMRAIWYEFLLSLRQTDVEISTLIRLQERFEEAVGISLDEHHALIENLMSDVKRGNLAYVILGLLNAGELRPGKRYFKDKEHRRSRFQERNCIWLKNGDLGVDPEALLQLVRAQRGYHDATRNNVALELKDLGAMVLHRNGKNTTNLVKLWDDGPWGYRIQINVLKDMQKKY